MPQGHASTIYRPRLDDLLAMMGITREQLKEMTAEDLFAAATRWQNTVTFAKAQRRPSPVDRLVASLPVPSASLANLN
jgi:electron transfer flavoprotein alpha/beta subunit